MSTIKIQYSMEICSSLLTPLWYLCFWCRTQYRLLSYRSSSRPSSGNNWMLWIKEKYLNKVPFPMVALHLFCIEIFQSSQHICSCWRFVVLCNLPPLSISSHLGWWNKRLNKNGFSKFNYVYAIIIIGVFWISYRALKTQALIWNYFRAY